ncbi:right-handed parallel beta-helix repeat-containing protein [Cohnella boryungensis]|uniref:Nitrous oxide reductase family maturation protein NosD n=1 Tax=Cohnella boryungensis TaxID=768479 RepID=A0ABV8SET3_9BACL
MAKIDWQASDTVRPADMNLIGQEINEKVDKVAGRGLSTEDYTTAEKNKLAGIAVGANNYVHPATHPPSIITQDANNRFMTDAEKTKLGDIAAGAQVNRAIATQTQAEAGTDNSTDMTPLRVAQAIAALSVGQRTATLVVAANNSSAKSKTGADYVCSGFSDQTTINNAINTLPASGGKVLLMEGLYTVSGSILLNSNVTLEGVGAATVIKLRNSHNANVNIISNADTTNGNRNILIRDLLIDGNKANQTSGTMLGIYLSIVEYCTVEQTKITNLRNDGISISGSNYNTITGNACSSNTTAGITISSGNNNTIIGNTCISNTGNGIYIFIGNNNTITDNTCSSNTANGINASDGNNTITGNTCSSNNNGITSVGNNNTITGNACSSNTTAGITISGGMYSNIQGNTVRKGTASPTYGLRISTGVGHYVTNNDLYQSGTTAFSDNGTGTITTAGNRT